MQEMLFLAHNSEQVVYLCVVGTSWSALQQRRIACIRLRHGQAATAAGAQPGERRGTLLTTDEKGRP